MIITVTERTFATDVVQSGRPTIVDLWAPWCQPCKALDRELKKLDEKFGEKLVIAKVNVDENPGIVTSLEIRTVPTLLFYDGKTNAPISIIGATTADGITTKFRLSEVSR